jgi:hypothetical protein
LMVRRFFRAHTFVYVAVCDEAQSILPAERTGQPTLE